jgi:ubiquinone/menaquinone biosynthesis C-methylase UbiE
VGPGIGINALPVATAVAPAGVLDAVDVQKEMVRDLSARAEHAGVTNIVAVDGDATKLSYADATFDGIFLVTVLGEIPDQDAALGELRRVIKPNGRLVIGEMFIDPDFIPLRELQDRARRAGFALERRQGPRFAYFARFRPT